LAGNEKQNSNSNLIFLDAFIKHKAIKILIDSGSEISLINKKLVKELNMDRFVYKIPRVALVGANNKKLTTVNEGLGVRIRVGDQFYIMQCVVIEDLNHDMIAGIDELSEKHITINFSENQLEIRAEPDNIEEEKETDRRKFSERINGQEKHKEINMTVEDKSKAQEKNQSEEEKRIKKKKKSSKRKQEKKEVISRKMEGAETWCSEYQIEIKDKEKIEEEITEEDREEMAIMDENPEFCEEVIRTVNTCEQTEDERKIICGENMEKEIEKILENYGDLINEESRVAKNYEHSFKVKNLENFKSKTYPIPYKYRQSVGQEIENMIKDKVIERCDSPYINPIVCVKKSNGDLRLCLDARNINSHTIAQYEAPLNIEAIFGRITGSHIFSKIDLKHSFWLIPLAEKCRNYTAFSIDGVVYRFRVVPFGLQSACAALVRALHTILNRHGEFVVHYIDDLLIFSPDITSHLRHIHTVLEELDQAGLKLNIQKCQFFQKEVLYLGFKLDTKGISLAEDRIEVINNYPRPTNLKTLRGFLGMVNYFKKLIPDLSTKEIPLIALLKKNVRWKWGTEQEIAFKNLKGAFSTAVRVHHPRYEQPFILRTDASIKKFAGVLSQIQDDIEVPICFVSRVTKTYERKYSVTELEFASVLFCVNKLRFYLLGARFTIETDHAALVHIMKNRLVNNRIHRGILLLQEYDFEFKYIKGTDNILADALTRDEQFRKEDHKTLHVGMNIMREEAGLFSLAKIRENQEELNEREKQRAEQENNLYFKRVDGKELYVITEQMAKEVFLKLHCDNGHIGSRKVWLMFRENYICRQDYTIAKEVTRNCVTCQKCKSRNFKNENVTKNVVARRKLDIVAIDMLSDLIPTTQRNKHILVMVDLFSKYVKLYACRTTKGIEILRKIDNFIETVGRPDNILLDNATYFRNERFKRELRERGIDTKFISIRHPQSNPSERFIQEVTKFLRIAAEEHHRHWDRKVFEIETYLNCAPNTVTKETPLYIMKGTMPTRPWEDTAPRQYEEVIELVQRRLRRSGEKYLQRQERTRRRRPIKFQKGDKVLVKALRVSNLQNGICAKLMPIFEGPYRVNTENGVNSYELAHIETGNIRGIFNIHDIYQYHE
jgi:hypothetical protein